MHGKNNKIPHIRWKYVLLTRVARLWVHGNHHLASCSPPGGDGAVQGGDAAGGLISIGSCNITTFQILIRDSDRLFHPSSGPPKRISLWAVCFPLGDIIYTFSQIEDTLSLTCQGSTRYKGLFLVMSDRVNSSDEICIKKMEKKHPSGGKTLTWII